MDRPPSRTLIDPYVRPMAPIATGWSAGGSLKAPIRCLLCDVYGTLFISGSGGLNTREAHSPPLTKIETLLRRYHIDAYPDKVVQQLHEAIAQHHRQSHTDGIDHPEIQIDAIWKKILPLNDEALIRRFAVQFEMIVNPVWPMPHLDELLRACRQRRIMLGIISNAQFFTPYLFPWFLGRELTELGFEPALVLFSYALGRAKPSRRLFETAARRLNDLGIAARQTAYIGNDMRNDIIPAGSVGFQTALFAGDARSLRHADKAPRDGRSLPDLVVTNLDQLIRWLQ